MTDEIALHALVRSDPELAWSAILDFVRQHPGSAASLHLIEELVYEHGDLFVTRLEAIAVEDPVVRSVIEQAYIGGDASEGAERFNRLVDRLLDERRRLSLDS
jgi:hypothetical protein